ncbi:protein ACCELERATED CELL DEATH 6-like [Salvia divinorum]|uniref:Protein ACCELERATED CELL DEATH 6-like n=1 Tax=Salvia divinorum TaxID=28513 RepID=A0ABD1H4Y2_SALDI
MASSSTFPQSSSPVDVAAASSPSPPSVAMANQGKEWHKDMAFYRAALTGEWYTAKQFLNRDGGRAVHARLGYYSETPLHVAVAAGNSESFVSNLLDLISDDSSLALTDSYGNSPLHVAAAAGNYHAAEILVARCPNLVHLSNHDSKFPHHSAADYGHGKILGMLISNTNDNHPVNPFAGDGGVCLLLSMVESGFFDMALYLVGKYPDLEWMKPKSIGRVLNKIAAKATTFDGNDSLSFWKRFIYWCVLKMDVKSQSFDVENQTSLESPKWCKLVLKLHSILCQVIKYLVPGIDRFHEKKLMHEQTIELVKCLCKHMESLDYNDAAAICSETMLTAAESGSHDVVLEIVETFPLAVHFRNSLDQNFLHLAIKNRCEKVFNLMYRTSKCRYQYSNAIDNDGNSILHLAARLAPFHKLSSVSGAALQMQREIQWFQEASKFVSSYTRGLQNSSGETAEMIFTKEHRDLKIEGETWMKDTANSCSIAAALIVTIVFAAAITVPGGNQSDSGYPMFYESSAFTIFAVSDAASLFTSSTSLLMFLSILTSRYAEHDFLYALPKRLCIGLFMLFLSILFMMIAFSSTLYLVFGRKKAWVLLPVGALTCLPISSFVLLQFPLLRDVISSTYGRGVFGKQSGRTRTFP